MTVSWGFVHRNRKIGPLLGRSFGKCFAVISGLYRTAGATPGDPWKPRIFDFCPKIEKSRKSRKSQEIEEIRSGDPKSPVWAKSCQIWADPWIWTLARSPSWSPSWSSWSPSWSRWLARSPSWSPSWSRWLTRTLRSAQICSGSRDPVAYVAHMLPPISISRLCTNVHISSYTTVRALPK